MTSRFDVTPIDLVCTLHPTASNEGRCDGANCRTCGFSVGEIARRKAMIRAGEMVTGPDGLKRLIIRRKTDDTI